jgi:predicted NUDIX family phosphoesterase
MDESVYCVAAASMPDVREEVQDLSDKLYNQLVSTGEFRLRQEVEHDESWRQIIPYAVVQYRQRVLLVRRKKAGSESRLHHQMSIGIGGHINRIDHGNARDLFEGGLARELREELVIGAFVAEPIGLIHSAGDPVSRVHTGVLYVVTVASPVSIRETNRLKGDLCDWREIALQYHQLEGWSKLTFDFLDARKV